MALSWKPIKDAPKIGPKIEKYTTFNGPEILGITALGEVKVIWWTTEYPCLKGAWMFAYEPDEYIDGIQEFDAVGWLPMDVLPELPEDMKYKSKVK